MQPIKTTKPSSITPAHITYRIDAADPESQTNTLHFHSIFTETHEASTELTQFPVMNGFVVTNHAIRKNRKVSIEALVTNTPIAKTKVAGYWKSGDNASEAFYQLQKLVNDAVVCKVVTNLGVYNNVVFNRFNTQQAEGMITAMRFTISGEELQLSTSVPTGPPIATIFTPVSAEFKPALIKELNDYGIPTKSNAELFQAQIKEGAGALVLTEDVLGNSLTVAYEALPTNVSTGKIPYLASFGIEDTFHFDKPEFDLYSLADALPDALEGAITGTKACLTEGGGSIIRDFTDDFIDTAIGVVRKTAYGAAGKIMDSIGLEKGGILWTVGRDCLVTGMSTAGDVLLTAGGADVFNVDAAGNKSTPDIQDVLDAARRVGQDTVSGVTGSFKTGTITKIRNYNEAVPRGILV
jgi:hypothetical protein